MSGFSPACAALTTLIADKPRNESDMFATVADLLEAYPEWKYPEDSKWDEKFWKDLMKTATPKGLKAKLCFNTELLHKLVDAELERLLGYRNIIKHILSVVEPKGNKKLILELTASLSGMPATFITGGGMTLATQRVIYLYEREGSVTCTKRRRRPAGECDNALAMKRAAYFDLMAAKHMQALSGAPGAHIPLSGPAHTSATTGLPSFVPYSTYNYPHNSNNSNANSNMSINLDSNGVPVLCRLVPNFSLAPPPVITPSPALGVSSPVAAVSSVAPANNVSAPTSLPVSPPLTTPAPKYAYEGSAYPLTVVPAPLNPHYERAAALAAIKAESNKYSSGEALNGIKSEYPSNRNSSSQPFVYDNNINTNNKPYNSSNLNLTFSSNSISNSSVGVSSSKSVSSGSGKGVFFDTEMDDIYQFSKILAGIGRSSNSVF